DLYMRAITDQLTDKRVLVTGAGGSIGSELCRQLIACKPARLVLFDLSEAALYQIDRELRELLDERFVLEHRARGLTPDRPVLRGTAQNPDVYFQGRETVNPWVNACPTIVSDVMERFGKITGRQYRIFEYHGAADATDLIVIMGSGSQTVQAAVEALNAQGHKLGCLTVRLYRPFAVETFVSLLPASVQRIAVLDRVKEPGAPGDPLYLDVRTAIDEMVQQGRAPFTKAPVVTGGRYGLSSKEFTPAMVKAVFDELQKDNRRTHFTVGITDDLTFSSLDVDREFRVEDTLATRAVFYGLGSDGTVGANKNSIKIIGENTDNHAQGYFVYDSKKSGSMTTSHLRFGPKEIRKPWLIDSAGFVACHQPQFLESIDMLAVAAPGATFLLNTPWPADQIWDKLPRSVQRTLLEKKIELHVIDAVQVAKDAGMGGRINTVMQTCFFAI
ncbi:MAG: 2-oxoacid:acceptor oxidoreductase family protein, partial [Candidatus Cloacimonetes bacterium]|nr:2-oxoacid:acceptor oxidoreductase family protein [Candidatus Cloacimonadota bacterium]